ncbi:hypothetical protein KUL150_31790 [Alteromonas sp. KUL150]|uniref:putative phage abortive infection protein n=1 Tax=Alteromonas sp. KUL150 TaxID=2480805 RepID=UPI0012E46760|nr:putative phage abortive infection protein [Alteromonas sp. KUL150]GFD87120.1 hypothetical protein KUL150_31790 [Alteromonas sp. KUL150]
MDFKKNLLKISAVIASVILGYFVILVWISFPIEEWSIANAALLGDSFGIVNSLFSGLAFAGLIVTILIQREELKETREIFKSQKFEDAFYRLLDVYNRNLNDITIKSDKKTLAGVAGLSFQLNKLQESMQCYSSFLNQRDEELVYRYELIQNINSILTPQSRYLGTIESILNLVDTGLDSNEESHSYIMIVSSQLTVHEVKYLFYQCLVLSTEEPLVRLVTSNLLLHERILEANINPKVIQFFNELHGSDLPTEKGFYYTPFSQTEIELVKSIKRTLATNGESSS